MIPLVQITSKLLTLYFVPGISLAGSAINKNFRAVLSVSDMVHIKIFYLILFINIFYFFVRKTKCFEHFVDEAHKGKLCEH